MHVTELYELTQWIDANVKAANAVQRYEELITVLQNNAQPGQQQQPFEDQSRDLQDALRGITFEALTKDQLRILEQLQIAQNVGSEAAAGIEDFLYRRGADVATAAKKIRSKMKQLASGIGRSDEIARQLETLELPSDLQKGEILLRVEFAEKASIENLTELRDWSKEWWEIGRGLALACNAAPETIRVIGAKRGSFVLELSVWVGVASLVAAVIRHTMSAVKETLETWMVYEDAREKRFGNSVLEVMKSDIEEKRASRVEYVTEQAIAAAPQDLDGEQREALKRSVKKLTVFYEKGGSVDYSIPQIEQQQASEDGDEEGTDGLGEQIEELRKEVAEIRQLAMDVARLEQMAPEDESDAEKSRKEESE